MMLAHINAPVAPSDMQPDAPRSSQREASLPPNPLLAQAAVRQYRQACENNKLAPRTIAEREALVTKLISYVALAKAESETSLYVHDIGTHHSASLLDSMANKSATDGARLRRAARVVSDHLARTNDGFQSGWSILRRDDDLTRAVRFYAERDIHPERWYPRDAKGRVDRFDDLAAGHRGNVDQLTPPMDRQPGDTPALGDGDVRDIVAFLRTLTDADAVNVRSAP